ncbi:hypothetical protein RRG08_010278 [Elysia crispata]|uniref:Uncharacterized protein n=1 Tax=Elysia crispata TaxID=231223 RepID=A0AAE0Z288_9GAST|nr:hypothetical protein RRG08_010278 [Elysia crispata]
MTIICARDISLATPSLIISTHPLNTPGPPRAYTGALHPNPNMLRRHSKQKKAYDTAGGAITFDEIGLGDHSVYVAHVDNMVFKEIPVKPIFDMFGRQHVIKAEFIVPLNQCRLSVMAGSTYAHSDGGASLVVTYNDLMSTIDSYPGGECVDGVICASYKTAGKLTFEPYVYEWKSLSLIAKFIRSALIAVILSIMVYLFKDSTVRDYMFVGLLLLKQNLLTVIAQLL